MTICPECGAPARETVHLDLSPGFKYAPPDAEIEKLNKLIGHLATCGFCGEDDPRACAIGGALYREWNDGKFGGPRT